MKSRVLTVLIFALCSIFSLTYADITRREPFYQVWIQKEIARYQHMTRLIISRGENLRYYGEQAAGRVMFYRHRQHNLIRDMVEASIGTRPYKINYFLIKAYMNYESHSSLVRR